jgi:hypothetical protein
MKKANKILMTAVAILLSLVLISTSVLSGVFAKFVITDKADISVGFTKWGVTVTLTPNTTQLNTVKTNGSSNATWGTTTDGVTFEIKNLKLAPGDDLSTVAHFTVTGNAEVPLRVNVKMYIAFDRADFTIPNTTGLENTYPNIEDAKGNSYFPVYIRTKIKNTSGSMKNRALSKPYRENATPKNMVTTGSTTMNTYLDVTKGTITDNEACVYKEFLTPGTDIVFYPKSKASANPNKNYPINDFYFGFIYYIDNTNSDGLDSVDKVNAVSTYLSQNKPNSTFDVRFTVSVEQIVT